MSAPFDASSGLFVESVSRATTLNLGLVTEIASSATAWNCCSVPMPVGAAPTGMGTEQQFQAVALDAISVTNPKFSVVARLTDSTNRPLDASNGADMTLGLNVLKHLHLYV